MEHNSITKENLSLKHQLNEFLKTKNNINNTNNNSNVSIKIKKINNPTSNISNINYLIEDDNHFSNFNNINNLETFNDSIATKHMSKIDELESKLKLIND